MAELKNELSWSRSRMSTLHSCHRQYYYQYYLKWGGWNSYAAEDSRQAYFLSKMTGLAAMVGDAAHRTIKLLLEQQAQYGAFQLARPAEYARREILSKCWNDGLAEKWRNSAKRFPPVFEIYYDQKPEADELKRLGQKLTRCLDTFLNSTLVEELRQDDPKLWLAIDPEFNEAPKFYINDHIVWALPDFVRRRPNGRIEIWDWKTGRKSEHDNLQLLSYALFAQSNWNVPADMIDLKAFYLDPELEHHGVVDYLCNEAELARIRDVIDEDLAHMKTLLSDVEKNIAHQPETHFPMIEDGPICKRCKFKEFCNR
jgi:hypothetical protein